MCWRSVFGVALILAFRFIADISLFHSPSSVVSLPLIVCRLKEAWFPTEPIVIALSVSHPLDSRSKYILKPEILGFYQITHYHSKVWRYLQSG